MPIGALRVTPRSRLRCPLHGAVVVPQKGKTIVVLGLGPKAQECSGTLVLANDMHTVSQFRFSNQRELRAVVLPDSLLYIGMSAFSSTGLEGRLVLPPNLRTVGAYAFWHCTRLHAIDLSPNCGFGYESFANCFGVSRLCIPPQMHGSVRVFADGLALRAICIPVGCVPAALENRWFQGTGRTGEAVTVTFTDGIFPRRADLVVNACRLSRCMETPVAYSGEYCHGVCTIRGNGRTTSGFLIKHLMECNVTLCDLSGDCYPVIWTPRIDDMFRDAVVRAHPALDNTSWKFLLDGEDTPRRNLNASLVMSRDLCAAMGNILLVWT